MEEDNVQVEEFKESSNTLELGDKIELSGFSDLDHGSIIILKKIIGNYVKNISIRYEDFENLKLTMKIVHVTEGSEKYEIKAKIMMKGSPYTAENTGRNLFMTVDSVLKKVEKSLG